MTTVGEGAEPQRSDITKAGLAALVASSIEWYDFFIYLTAAALVFPAVFFPESSAVAGVLASFSTAAVGFVARPIGGVLFGHFGDRLGRKPTLVIALILMGTATVLVGLLPGFATIGVWAPILLFVFRFCQGLAIGGQWGGAVLLATEYAPPNRRGLFGSLAQTGVPVGVIFGNLIFLAVGALTTEAQFLAWGWRIPFLIGVLLIGVAMYIQLRLEETPAFRHLEEQQEGNETQQRSPVLEVIREHPKQILLAGGAFFVINGSFYILISGILDYGTRSLGLSSDAMLTAVLISSAIQIPALLGFAALTDRVGRRPVYLIGAVLPGAVGVPYVLAREHERHSAHHLGPLVRADLPEHDVRSAGSPLRRDVQRTGALFRSFAGLPGGGGFRRRTRADHHGLAAGDDGHLALGILLHTRDGRHNLHIGLLDHGYLRGRDVPGRGRRERSHRPGEGRNDQLGRALSVRNRGYSGGLSRRGESAGSRSQPLPG